MNDKTNKQPVQVKLWRNVRINKQITTAQGKEKKNCPTEGEIRAPFRNANPVINLSLIHDSVNFNGVSSLAF